MLSHIATSAKDFFFAAPGVPSEDPLVAAVRRDAQGTQTFVASVGTFSAYMATLTCLVFSAFLALHWDDCGGFDRPLRWWAVMYVLLQACQVPVRVVLVVGLRNATAVGDSSEAFLTSLTASRGWRASLIVGRLLYTWEVLGTLWWLSSESCPSCPGIQTLIVASLSTTALRA